MWVPETPAAELQKGPVYLVRVRSLGTAFIITPALLNLESGCYGLHGDCQDSCMDHCGGWGGLLPRRMPSFGQGELELSPRQASWLPGLLKEEQEEEDLPVENGHAQLCWGAKHPTLPQRNWVGLCSKILQLCLLEPRLRKCLGARVLPFQLADGAYSEMAGHGSQTSHCPLHFGS